MKSLQLKQVEIEIDYGTVRLLVNRFIDGEKMTPHLIGLFAHDDVDMVLANNEAALAAEGYPWIDAATLKRALDLREAILADPTVSANNRALQMEREAAQAAAQAELEAAAATEKAATAEREKNEAERIREAARQLLIEAGLIEGKSPTADTDAATTDKA